MAKKILLADDSLTIQKVVELTFSDSDYQLTSVSNGQRALDKVREERPDLILADVVMPEKNGYEVCEAIKGNPATAKIPVVLLSGTFEPFDRDRAERIGADAIVSKPFDSQQLLAQVEALLARVPREAPAAAAHSGATTAVLPMASLASDKTPPFEVGFTAEDFTGTVRLPPVPERADPFEEEYGRAGVDSAIEAFETAQPGFGFGAEPEIKVDDAGLTTGKLVQESARSSAQWLADEPEKAAPKPAAPPRELEELASGTTIPMLRQMLSTVARTNGELSDADIERLATKIVEKLSDKIVREIAWEVIPDMAEIVIRQRIKELESGVE